MACEGWPARSLACTAHKHPTIPASLPCPLAVYKKELSRTLKKAAKLDPKKSKKVGRQVGKALAPMAASPCGPCLLPLALLGVALYFPIKAAVKAFRKAKLQERLMLEQELRRQQQQQLEAQQFEMVAPAAVPLQTQAQVRAVPVAPQQLPMPLAVPVQAAPQPLQPQQAHQQPQQPQPMPAAPQSRLPEPLMPTVPQHPLPQCLTLPPQHLQPVCILAA